MSNKLKCQDLFTFNSAFFELLFSGCEYPWEILPQIKELAERFTKSGIEGYTLIKDGILAGDDVLIDPCAHIDSPCIIGRGTVIRPGAYIRGAVIIGEECVIGNSSEMKNCIVMDRAQIPHYNYVGDSVLGEGAHLGAGAICSNLRSDRRPVNIKDGATGIKTGLKKLGAILGDGVEVGCGAVLCPGTVLGKRTAVYPLTLVRGTYPSDCILKNDGSLIKRTTE